jgi:acyl-CoA reductase-like NAD-dependent aldehyde dehydrogenase
MSSKKIECLSPSTREVIFKHDGVSVDEARTLVDRSHEAFKIYRKVPLAERKAIMIKALDYLTASEDVLAKELTLQMGRPISAAASELRTMRKRAEYFLETAEEALSDIPGKAEDGFERWVSRVPLGPVFISSAWNVSLYLGNHHDDRLTERCSSPGSSQSTPSPPPSSPVTPSSSSPLPRPPSSATG